MSNGIRRAVVAAVFFGLAGAVRAADWPQWRGPTRDGISRETGLLKEWPKDGPKLLWQVNDLGDGYSTPSVVGDRMYVMYNRGDADEFVSCRAAADGKEIWAKRVGKVGPNIPQMAYPGARSTPTVDGDGLYALGSDGDLVCLDRASGNVKWQKNLQRDFGGKIGKWAYAESPLVDGDVVVCTPGGADAALVALKKGSGEVVWKCAVSGGEEAGYSSVIVVDAAGVRQYVQFLEKGLIGVDAKTGKALWRYDKTAQGSPANIPTPVARDGLVYSSTGRGGGGLVKLAGEGGSVKASQVYAEAKLPNAIGGTVLLGDFLYGTTGSALMCVTFKTGDAKWSDRSVGAGSVLYADKNLYVHGENGEVALVEASPEGYREKGRFTPPGQPERGRSKAWAYPVVANGKMYVRDGKAMWCYDVKDPNAVN